MKKKILVAAVLGTAVGVGIYFGKKYLGKLRKEINEMGKLEDEEDWDEDICEDDFEDDFEDDDEAITVEPEKDIKETPTVEDKIEDVIPTADNLQTKTERPWDETNSTDETTPVI